MLVSFPYEFDAIYTTKWLTSWLWSWEPLNSAVAAIIASLCYQCGCEVGTSREAWYLQSGVWVADRLNSNHRVILISDSDNVGDVKSDIL